MVVHAVTRIQMSTKSIKHRNFTNHVCQSLPYESLEYMILEYMILSNFLQFD